MRIVIVIIGVLVVCIVAIGFFVYQPEPRVERYDDTEERTTLTILANEYLDRERAEIRDPTESAQHLCGPYGLFPDHANSSGSKCVGLLANRSHIITTNSTNFEAGYATLNTPLNASAQLNETIARTRELLAERLVPNGEIENHNQIVRGQLGPDVDEARFLSTQLENGTTYRTVSLLRVERTIYFVIEESAEQTISRRYTDAFSSEKHDRLLEIYDVSIIR